MGRMLRLQFLTKVGYSAKIKRKFGEQEKRNALTTNQT